MFHLRFECGKIGDVRISKREYDITAQYGTNKMAIAEMEDLDL